MDGGLAAEVSIFAVEREREWERPACPSLLFCLGAEWHAHTWSAQPAIWCVLLCPGHVYTYQVDFPHLRSTPPPHQHQHAAPLLVFFLKNHVLGPAMYVCLFVWFFPIVGTCPMGRGGEGVARAWMPWCVCVWLWVWVGVELEFGSGGQWVNNTWLAPQIWPVSEVPTQPTHTHTHTHTDTTVWGGRELGAKGLANTHEQWCVCVCVCVCNSI